MSREDRIHTTHPDRRAPRLRPESLILAGMMMMAVPLAGCMCLRTPSSSLGGADGPGTGPPHEAVPAATVAADHPVAQPASSPPSPSPAGGRGVLIGSIGETQEASRRSADPSVVKTASDAPPLGSPQPPPSPVADIMTPAIPASPEYPIDLPTALRLAERENPVIAEARARISEALGRQQQARVELLPMLNAGANYDGHAGNLQQSNGTILNVSRQAVYFGGGAGAIGALSPTIPAVSITEPLANAIYDPLAAHQRVHQARFDASATANNVLLEVANYYLDLLAATARLEAQRRSAEEAAELTRITERYAQFGEGRPFDADRARTEWRIRRTDVRRAEEEKAIASARLCRRLHLDPSIQIRPVADDLKILALIDLDTELPALLQIAIEHRPEVKASTANLAATEVRWKQELARPFLPSLFLGFSGGAFGGGSNLNTPLVGNFAGRTDLDVAAYWTLENFGFGNLSLQRRRRAQVGEATGQRARTANLVREQVASAFGDARAQREQIAIDRVELATAMEGYRRDIEQMLGAVRAKKVRAPRPIEVLNSLTLLAHARLNLIRSITNYDQSQFRLFVAMGSPPPLDQPADSSSPAVAISTLSAPAATNLPNQRPSDGADARPAEASRPSPMASASSPSTRRDEDVPPIARELIAAESGLARTLQQLRHDGVPGDGSIDRFAGLAKAHQKSLNALLEYDRLQEKLFRTLGARAGTAGPAEQVDQLMGLAEAHRKLLTSKVDYDEALWDLLRALKAKAPNPAPAAEPSITRRQTKDVGTNTK